MPTIQSNLISLDNLSDLITKTGRRGRTAERRRHKIAPTPKWNPKILAAAQEDRHPKEPLRIPSADPSHNPLESTNTAPSFQSGEGAGGPAGPKSRNVNVPRVTPKRDPQRNARPLSEHRFTSRAPRKMVAEIGEILDSNRLDRIQTSVRKTMRRCHNRDR